MAESPDRVVQNLIAAAAEQAENPALWQEPSAVLSALLTYELQRLHELIFKLHGWQCQVENMDHELVGLEREMEAMREALRRTGIEEAKLIYELGHLRGSFMAYAVHRLPCFGVPCTCGFEHEQNRVRAGIMRHGVSA
jgi:hypothetical protein